MAASSKRQIDFYSSQQDSVSITMQERAGNSAAKWRANEHQDVPRRGGTSAEVRPLWPPWFSVWLLGHG